MHCRYAPFSSQCSACTIVGMTALSCAAFDTLHEAKEYEHIMNTAIKGVPEHWIPAIAQQCLYAPIQNTGKRCARLLRFRA